MVERNAVVSFTVTAEVRHVLHQLQAHLTIKHGERFTLTDVIERAVVALAKKEKVDAE